MNILLMEHNVALGKSLLAFMQGRGHAVTWVKDAASVVVALTAGRHHALVLDLSHDSPGGFGALESVRVTDAALPVIVLSELSVHRKRAFELGADDYLSRPFHPEELLARLQVKVRRAAHE